MRHNETFFDTTTDAVAALRKVVTRGKGAAFELKTAVFPLGV